MDSSVLTQSSVAFQECRSFSKYCNNDLLAQSYRVYSTVHWVDCIKEINLLRQVVRTRRFLQMAVEELVWPELLAPEWSQTQLDGLAIWLLVLRPSN